MSSPGAESARRTRPAGTKTETDRTLIWVFAIAAVVEASLVIAAFLLRG